MLQFTYSHMSSLTSADGVCIGKVLPLPFPSAANHLQLHTEYTDVETPAKATPPYLPSHHRLSHRAACNMKAHKHMDRTLHVW
jgi:hypothetical protein